MLQHDRAPRPRQFDDPVSQARIGVFLGEAHRLLACLSRACHDVDPHGLIGRDSNRAADRGHRVEGAACPIRKLKVVECLRAPEGSPTADEVQSIGFEAGITNRRLRASGSSGGGHHMEHPGLLFPGRSRTASGQDGTARLEYLRLHKEIGKGGVRLVLRLGGEGDFGVAGYFNPAHPVGTIGQRNPPQFNIIFRRNCDQGVGIDFLVMPAKFDPRLHKNCFITRATVGGRLPCRRPQRSCVEIAQIT